MNKQNARNLLHQFDFKGLFLNELGWDDHSGALPLTLPDKTVPLEAVAEKRGMVAYLCPMPGAGKTYDYQTRCRIEIQLAKCVREHLIIYFDSGRRFQTWQWVKREPGQPVARREHTYTIGQSGEALLQKLEALEIKIEEEEQLTLVGVTARARQAFDVDRVTKRFYDRFKTEHAAFLKQIDGIEDEDEREWYASIMLNRLKFVYFIQKKGFLDKDTDYLRNRLAAVQKARPKTKFLTFYRAFLLRLFHDGLGRKQRTPALCELLGTVPYLNGGIFAVHPLEEKHDDIDIPDKAFEKVFAFFDQYRWHLDERPLRADDEINPDVLGYIFEKYINQKQMGAYYTKEDITEYIAKNCIVPFILDRVEASLTKKGKEADFRALFDLLKADPDRYIYDPIKHGLSLPLPSEIEKGIDTSKPKLLERRAAWNKPAPSEYALPTEIWREVVARRQRYQVLRTTLAKKSASLGINDLITLNLNIRQFAQDCIENTQTPEVLWAFWKGIEEITVLDPTCGSGAFLFAAVNVLEPLYEACLDRMKAFMLEWSEAKKVPHPNFYKDFAAVIARVEKHANEKYFIFKSIIIRNLYGVDIMDEAVEICKLRLFLKLAAQIEPNYDEENLGIEPLPDIDFNIRAGNTLVGFATEKQAEDVIRQDLLAYNTVWPEVQRDAKEIAELFSLFREQQTEIGGAVSAEDKARLRKKLAPLEDRLNTYLAETYGVTKKRGLKDWVHSHKPFHWFIEFYEIMANAGFDVIIGNPPYVEFTPSKVDYQIRGFETEECGNLYAYIMERSLSLLQSGGRSGLIVLIGSMCTERMAPLQNLHAHQCERLWLSTYSGHTCPSVLFDGVANRFAIWLSERGTALSDIYTSKYLKWYADERPYLFPLIHYHPSRPFAEATTPKLGALPAASILVKILRQTRPLGNYMAGSGHLYVYTTPIHWMKAYDFRPYFKCGDKTLSTQFKPMPVSEEHKIEISGVLNSSLFFVWWIMRSDCYHLVSREIDRFPFDAGSLRDDIRKDIRRLSVLLTKDIQKKSFIGTRNQKTTGLVRFQVTDPKLSKPIIDEIDQVLAKHYGFTDEELDFVINYDIKYRVGRDGQDAEEE